ncbi:MAG: aminotransferase class I/II-fold pyridoxal phosphate-dependent enzyme [Acidimicrobiales bacterium]
MVKREPGVYQNSLIPPVYHTATYVFQDTEEVLRFHEGGSELGRYGRYHNPTWHEAEVQLAELDRCEEALLFPSGMSAISTTLFGLLSAGDQLLYTNKGYRNIRRLCQDYVAPSGVDVVGLDPADTDSFNASLDEHMGERTKAILVEIPSNPHQHLVDLEYICERKPDDAMLIVDSTFATPVNFQPKMFGADLVLHSATKYMAGHADLMAGTVAGDSAVISRLRTARDVIGSIPDANSAFLLTRSLATLPIRMAHLNSVGMEIAKYLNAHPRINNVLYTGLPDHPHHSLAQRYLSGHGSVMCFDLDTDREGTSRFVDALEIPRMGTNFGSTQSMVEQVSVFNNFSAVEAAEVGISDSTVRIYVGFEDLDDLVADIERALVHI